MKFSRYKAIAKKEFKHLFRDYRMLLILLLFPIFLLIIFGYAINFDVKNIKTAVLDYDKSEISREYIRSLFPLMESGNNRFRNQGVEYSSYFSFAGNLESDREIKEYLDNKYAQLVIVIPPDFSKNYYSNKEAKIQFLIDGVDGNTAQIIQNYANLSIVSYSSKSATETVMKKGGVNRVLIDFNPRFWFNPELNSTLFLVPGLIAMILIVTSAISVSLSLVREKERGTMEQISVSPVSVSELLLGKTTPYLIFALLNAVMILVAGYFLFGVVVKGSYVLLFLTTFIFLFATTSIGVFVSVISSSQQIAFSISTFATLLPSLILSGFIFPIESMPSIIQIFSYITPARFFIVILRAIILRGVGIEAFYMEVILLLVFGIGLLLISGFLYNRNESKI